MSTLCLFLSFSDICNHAWSWATANILRRWSQIFGSHWQKAYFINGRIWYAQTPAPLPYYTSKMNRLQLPHTAVDRLDCNDTNPFLCTWCNYIQHVRKLFLIQYAAKIKTKISEKKNFIFGFAVKWLLSYTYCIRWKSLVIWWSKCTYIYEAKFFVYYFLSALPLNKIVSLFYYYFFSCFVFTVVSAHVDARDLLLCCNFLKSNFTLNAHK